MNYLHKYLQVLKITFKETYYNHGHGQLVTLRIFTSFVGRPRLNEIEKLKDGLHTSLVEGKIKLEVNLK